MISRSETAMLAELSTSSQNFTLVYHYGPRQCISNEAMATYTFICVIISEGLSVLGVVTNTINVVVFVKLGLREPISISMFSLAVSDLLVSTLALWSNLLYLPQFQNLGLPFRSEEAFTFSGGVTRQFVTRTSAIITTFITVERCLCVIVPLRVKEIITRMRAVVGIVTIFVITIGPSLFIFGNYKIGWYYYPDVNRTLLGTRYVDGEINNIVDRIITSVVGSFLLQFSFVATLLCIIYLVVYLRKAARFRRSHATKNALSTTLNKVYQEAYNHEALHRKLPPTSRSTNKEDRIVRTVVIIAATFIICFSPGCVAFLLYVFLPGFTLFGVYGQLFRLVFALCYITEAINSSVNLFIYYTMATNFRDKADSKFGWKEKTSGHVVKS